MRIPIDRFTPAPADENLPLVLPTELDLIDGQDEPEPEVEEARMR
ncbi:hypothetical protein C8D87_11344 [Lentzea atacamensis]|uniref:Uncharacterized protein n=1 Tax=Lentzea atacamensis TaxID=531938 RepID=A0ABX9DWE9_9PSEU|nr:hypothetical protein [Lentzea atacamensis]RAS59744.1 hypothetical protein C8D87_11344 [Lentzea atacamensis]